MFDAAFASARREAAAAARWLVLQPGSVAATAGKLLKLFERTPSTRGFRTGGGVDGAFRVMYAASEPPLLLSAAYILSSSGEGCNTVAAI